MICKLPGDVEHTDESIFLIIAPICLTPSHPPQAEKLGQMKRQWQYQCKASHTLTPFMQTLNICRCSITYSGCSSAPCAPAPKRGKIISRGTSITHSPQRPVPQTRTKTPPCLWRRWPRPLLSVNGAGRGLRLSIQSRIRGGFRTACSKQILKMGFLDPHSPPLYYCVF